MPSAPSNRRRRLWAGLAPLVAGALVGLGFQPGFSVLAWLALIPLAGLWSLDDRPEVDLRLSWLGGTLALALGIGWMRNCDAGGGSLLGPYTLAWLVTALIAGGFFAGMCWYGDWIARRTRWPMTIVLPTVWATQEIALRYAGGWIDETGFPWAKLGATLADWPRFLQLADLGGVYGLSVLLAAASGAVVDAIVVAVRLTNKKATRPLLLASPLGFALLLVAALAYGEWRLGQPVGLEGPSVRLMGSLDMPPGILTSRLPDASEADLLVWPELAWHHALLSTPARGAAPLPEDIARRAGPGDRDYSRYVRRAIEQDADRLGATLVIGCEFLRRRADGWSRYNAVACASPESGLAPVHQKTRLVPWAEFTPHAALLGQSEENYLPGSATSTYECGALDAPYTFRPAICYEVCFPAHFRAAEGALPDFFVQIGAEGQDRSGVLPERMLAATRLRAVETRRAIVRNVLAGYSGVVDSNGRFHGPRRPMTVKKPRSVDHVPIDHRSSLYARTGDTPLVLLCCLAPLLASVARAKKPD